MREKLQGAREKQALVDRKEAEVFALKLKDVVIEQEVKVDPDGKMYGSVTQMEIVKLLQDAGYELERRNLLLPTPIKTLGTHQVKLRLKEGVEAEVKLKVRGEGKPEPAPVLSEEIVEKPSE